MSRPRKPICPHCGFRPKAPRKNYCRECDLEIAIEQYQKREAKRKQERLKRFEELEAWCRAEGIRELARRGK